MKPTLFVIVLALVWSALLGPVNAAPAATTKSTSSMRVLAACDPTQGQDKFGCYEESLLHVVKTSGVATAMDMLLVRAHLTKMCSVKAMSMRMPSGSPVSI